MKQTLKIILFSSLVGTILAGIFFLTVKDKAEAKIIPHVYAYQVGVYKNEANALNSITNYHFAKVVKDHDLYRVFIGVTVNNKDLLSKYFNELGYSYYLKELQLSEAILKEIENFDILLAKTSIDTQNKVIEKMLESLPNEL